MLHIEEVRVLGREQAEALRASLEPGTYAVLTPRITRRDDPPLVFKVPIPHRRHRKAPLNPGMRWKGRRVH